MDSCGDGGTAAPIARSKVYDLYPGYACNARCLFCFNPAEAPKDSRGFPFEAVAREMYRMRGLGHRHMNILGGEPTVRRDLPSLCALAKKVGFLTVAITSNGIRTANNALVRRLKAARLDLAILSVHGHTPGLHDSIVGVPGALEKVLRSVGNFLEAGIGLQAAFVAHRRNHAFLPDFVREFLGRGVRHFTVLCLRYHGHMDMEDGRLADLKIPVSEVARSVEQASRILLGKGLPPPRLCHIPPCVLPGFESRMDNLIHPECAVFDGFYLDPETRNPSSTWIDHKDKIKLPRCTLCVFCGVCPGVEAAYLRVFGDGEFQPLTERPLPFAGRGE